ARARLGQAVARAGATGVLEAPVLIDGKPVVTAHREPSVDPGNPTRVVCESGFAGTAEADHALNIAAPSWPSWRDAPWKARAGVLFRAAAILRDQRDELTALEVYEAGKPVAEADADVCEAIDFCEFYAREALRIGAGVPIVQAPGERNTYRYQPRGI